MTPSTYTLSEFRKCTQELSQQLWFPQNQQILVRTRTTENLSWESLPTWWTSLRTTFPSRAPPNPQIRMPWYSEGTWMWVRWSPVWICGTSLHANFPEKPFQGYVHVGSPPVTNPSLDLRGWGLPVNVWVGSKGSYFLGWGSCRFDQCSSLTSSLFNNLIALG